jgi:putative salt-induced outer membrane protein
VKIILATYSLASIAADETPKGVTGAAEFGMVISSGNTDNSTTNGKFEISNDVEKWLHFGSINIVVAETDGITTAERYLLNLKSNYKLDESQFLFTSLSHDVDKFSGFDSQSTFVLGYGRNLFDTKEFKLSAEIGPGYRVSELEAGGNDSVTVFHLGAKSKYEVNDDSHFVGNLSIDSGSDQTITIIDLGYVNKLSKALSLKLGYNYKNSSNVPIGAEKTDTITSVNLLYNF